jgi:Fe-S-cluster formation regulator IscX/YfhJ
MHSQHKEHEIIIPFFDDIDPKTLNFLDIGANDGGFF